MKWYRLAKDYSINELQDELRRLHRERVNLALLVRDRTATPQELGRKREVDELIVSLENLLSQQTESQKERIKRTKNQPHLMTQEDFVAYHMTGNIAQDAYASYEDDLSWLGVPEEYPVLVKSERHAGEQIEFRQTGRPEKYVKTDENGDVVYNKGLAVYLDEEEARQQGLPVTDTTVVAFNEEGHPVGLASNEFGADGIWVIKAYQRKGIGMELLDLLRSQFKPDRKMGQMTADGLEMAKAYHKRLVQKALEQGTKVPKEVLRDYNDEPWASV